MPATSTANWTKLNLALLGRLPDAELARILGITEQVVLEAREARGIQPFKRETAIRWKESQLDLLGTISDAKLARKFRISRGIVRKFRKALGISAFQPKTAIH
jgi:hypothetical protein